MAPTYVSSVLLDTCWTQVRRIPTEDSFGDQARVSEDPDATSRSLSDEIEQLSYKSVGQSEFDDAQHNESDTNNSKNEYLSSNDNAADPNETKNEILVVPNTKGFTNIVLEDPGSSTKSIQNGKESNVFNGDKILESKSYSTYDSTVSNDVSFVYFEDFKVLNGLIEEKTNLKLFQPSDFALIYSQFEEQKEDPEATTMSKSDVVFFYDSLLDVKFTEDAVLLKNEPVNHTLSQLEYENFMHSPKVFSSSSSLNSPITKIKNTKKPVSIAKTKLKTPMLSIYDKQDPPSFDNSFLNYKSFSSNDGSSFYKLQNEIYSKEHEIQYRDELISKLEIQLSQFEDKTKNFDSINKKLNKELFLNQQYNEELLKMTNDLADLRTSFKGLKLKNENLVKENTELSGCITELMNKVSDLEEKQNHLMISSSADLIPESPSENGNKNVVKPDKDIKLMDKKLAQLAKTYELENSKLLKKIELLEKSLLGSNLKVNLFLEKFKTLKNNKLDQFNKLQSILQRQNFEKSNALENNHNEENPKNTKERAMKLLEPEVSFDKYSQSMRIHQGWFSKFHQYISRYNISYKQLVLFCIVLIVITLVIKRFMIFPLYMRKYPYGDSHTENPFSNNLLHFINYPHNPLNLNHNPVDTLKMRYQHDPDFQMFVNQNN